MAIVRYSETDDFDLVNSGQDCMGWTVVDEAGNKIGEVNEMLIDSTEMRVDSIMIGKGVRVEAADIAILDDKVAVRGVVDKKKYAETERVAKETTTSTYKAAPPRKPARNVDGVTRVAKDDEIKIPIIEEQLVVGKRIVKKGGVRVSTDVKEREVSKDVNLREENVDVTRRKVDRPADADAIDAFKEGTVEVTTQAEVPVVDKDARVVGEVVVDKDVTERTETVSETVKRTEVDVDEIEAKKKHAKRK